MLLIAGLVMAASRYVNEKEEGDPQITQIAQINARQRCLIISSIHVCLEVSAGGASTKKSV
jgi:hypothetical protein